MLALTPFRDAADSRAASFRPDMAAEVDTLEDHLAEIIADMLGKDVPPDMFRVIVAIAAGALREAEDRGIVREMFGAGAPVKEDLEQLAAKLRESIDGDSNPRLAAKCLDFVYGLGLDGGKSQTEIAAEEGVCKATVSKRCINLRQQLNLAPARGMKTDKARASYSLRQRGKRARPPRADWSFKSILKGIFVAPAHAL